jgi:Tol biopolymer transport system component
MRLVLCLFLLLFSLILGIFTSAFALVRRQPSQAGWVIVDMWDGNDSDVYRLLPDGTHLTNLTAKDKRENWSVPSGDNRWLLYTALEDMYQVLYRMDHTGSHVEKLTRDEMPLWYSTVAWSPDGEWLAYEWYQQGYSRLGMMRADGSVSFNLSNDIVDLCTGKGQEFYSESYPQWSPDGEWLYYQATLCSSYQSVLYRVRPDGSHRRKVMMLDSSQCCFAWSPDSQWIAYMQYDLAGWRYYRMRPNGSDKKLLTPNVSYVNNNYEALDNEWIYFEANNGNHYQADIFRTNWEGTLVENLTNSRRYDFSPILVEGWLYFHSRRDRNLEIYRMRPDGSDVQNLSHHPRRDEIAFITPDGEWIYFLSNRKDGRWHYRMRSDGSDVTRFETHLDPYSYPEWHPYADSPWQVWTLAGMTVLVGGCALLVGRFRLRKNQ